MLSAIVLLLSIVMPHFIYAAYWTHLVHFAEFYYAECRYAECHYAELCLLD